jgi:hypothetical protein
VLFFVYGSRTATAAVQFFLPILSLAFCNSKVTGTGLAVSAASDANVECINTKKRRTNLYIKKAFKKIN